MRICADRDACPRTPSARSHPARDRQAQRQRLEGVFLPAGESWRAAQRAGSVVALYSQDGLHPTVAGSYAAALMIVGGLTGHAVTGLPAVDGVTAETAAALQAAAEMALAAERQR